MKTNVQHQHSKQKETHITKHEEQETNEDGVQIKTNIQRQHK